LAVYYIDWKDIIISVFDSAAAASFLDNAAGMRVRGGEVALTARPIHSLTFASAFAYTDAYMTESNVQLGAAKGERMPTVPRFSGSLTADYAFSDVRWQPTMGAAVRYTGDRTASFDENFGFPQYEIPAYTTVELRAGLSFTSYDVQLYVRNLLDERGQVSAYTWQGNPRPAIQQPRTIGLTVTARF
jgi:outer membrane receptor protein involved in Fe transport